MNSISASQLMTSSVSRSRSTLRAAFTLIALAPIIAEVLSGATRLSYIFVLVPEMMVWGCGTLLIREVVRRWRAGATSMLFLGLGLAIAEEFIIQQTSLAPLPWLGTAMTYGRQFGVNWLYFLFMLGYESVFVVLVPVQVTELIFPERRDQPWLKLRGLIISSFVFLFGSFIAWFSWTQRARPLTFHVPVYRPSAWLIVGGLAAIVLLVIAACLLRGVDERSTRKAPPAWIPGVAALFFGFPWYVLMTLIFTPNVRPSFSFWVAMAGGVVWGVLAYFAIRHWSLAVDWSDMHRWVLAFTATFVCMAAGFAGSSLWSRSDVIAKVLFNFFAVTAFVYLGVLIRRRAQVAS